MVFWSFSLVLCCTCLVTEILPRQVVFIMCHIVLPLFCCIFSFLNAFWYFSYSPDFGRHHLKPWTLMQSFSFQVLYILLSMPVYLLLSPMGKLFSRLLWMVHIWQSEVGKISFFLRSYCHIIFQINIATRNLGTQDWRIYIVFGWI